MSSGRTIRRKLDGAVKGAQALAQGVQTVLEQGQDRVHGRRHDSGYHGLLLGPEGFEDIAGHVTTGQGPAECPGAAG